MNFFQRAIKNITRRPTKSVLLLLTFFIIGNFVIIGIGISSAANQAKIMTRKSMRAVVEYTVDYEAVNEYISSLSESDLEELNSDPEASNALYSISADEFQQFLNDPRVVTYNATNYFIGSADIQSQPIGNDREQNDTGGISVYTDAEGNQVEMQYIEPEFRIMTNRTPNMIELAEGTWTITSGRFYTQEEIDSGAHVAVISEEVAALNGLSVGDTFTMNFVQDFQYMESMGVQFSEEQLHPEIEIIGIYSTTETIDPNSENFDWMSRYESPYNRILMPNSTYMDLQLPLQQAGFDYYAAQMPNDPYYGDPNNRPTLESNDYINGIVFLLDDPLNVEPFINDYSEMLSKNYRMFNADNDTFNQMARPLDSISLYANVIVAIVVVNAIIIITLVTALTLKTREYEIGVLVSIGASKLKVISQLFVELIIIGLVGFTLSVVSGSMIASTAGEALLNYQVAVDESYATDSEDIYYSSTNDYFTDISQEDLLSNYNVSISPLIIGEIYVAGIGIVLISILIPSLMILRFNPKRILTASL